MVPSRPMALTQLDVIITEPTSAESKVNNGDNDAEEDDDDYRKRQKMVSCHGTNVSLKFLTVKSFVICFIRGQLPSEVDMQFLQIVSDLETYGLDAHLVMVSFCNLSDHYKYW